MMFLRMAALLQHSSADDIAVSNLIPIEGGCPDTLAIAFPQMQCRISQYRDPSEWTAYVQQLDLRFRAGLKEVLVEEAFCES